MDEERADTADSSVRGAPAENRANSETGKLSNSEILAC